ncbi:hypothetical protein PoB_002898900 [Plakobranchus ocellatus]|uniref:Uncharacterized protein n=1 Tax=Plakobranchus ocellatus TaxID=259542 RepID=A0AAV4A7J0_9GAST|nr:hypothetical protein PoB_002898900 [Plakobranchus ocellatus]
MQLRRFLSIRQGMWCGSPLELCTVRGPVNKEMQLRRFLSIRQGMWCGSPLELCTSELRNATETSEQRNTTGVVTLKGSVGQKTKKTRRAVHGPTMDMGHCTARIGRVSRAR